MKKLTAQEFAGFANRQAKRRDVEFSDHDSMMLYNFIREYYGYLLTPALNKKLTPAQVLDCLASLEKGMA